MLLTLFCPAGFFQKVELNSHSFNCYFFPASIETELLTNTGGNQTLTKCQGCNEFARNCVGSCVQWYVRWLWLQDECKADIKLLFVDFGNAESFWYAESLLIYVFRCPMKTSFLRERTDDVVKTLNGIVQSVKEQSFSSVSKVVVTDCANLSFENFLCKNCVIQPFFANPNNFLIVQAGQNCLLKEVVFRTKPVHKLNLCLVKTHCLAVTTWNDNTCLIKKLVFDGLESTTVVERHYQKFLQNNNSFRFY